MKSCPERLLEMIDDRGWKGSLVPISRLAELREVLRSRREGGLLSEAFVSEFIHYFSFEPPEELPDARSIIIVGVPTPQMRVFFHWRGEKVPVIIPPTYVSFIPRIEETRAVLSGWLRPEGYRLGKMFLPLKTLAVRSGLAEYGRNNICYIPGMGSFLELVGAVTDLPCETDPWREPKALDLCETCVVCRNRCPSGAISEKRFLIQFERCLTYHNESMRDFPDWIDPSWHHCLVGCMGCQTACPENRELRDWVEDRAEFTEEETVLILEQVPVEELPGETAAKIKSLEIGEEYLLLARNLSVLLTPGKSAEGSGFHAAPRIP